MSTSKEFLNYFSEQCREIPDITFRPMMGEYLVYYRGKLMGDICDNVLFLKPVPSVRAILPNAEMQPPYEGAKPMLVFDYFENAALIKKLFDAAYNELPEPKKKAKK